MVQQLSKERRFVWLKESDSYLMSFATPEEWLEFSKNKGTLVEELYKRDGWQQLLRLSGAKGDVRRKMIALSAEEIARLLVMLDHS